MRRQRGEHVRRSTDTPVLRDFAADCIDRRLGGLRVGDLSPRRLDGWRRELEAAGVSTYILNRSKTQALDLRWEMVDRERLLLPAELTKGRMARPPDIPRPILVDLGRRRLACGALGRLIFPRPTDGHRWTKADWDNWRKRGFTKAAGAAGLLDWDAEPEGWVGDFRPYDLRHTCASLMIRAHVGPADVGAQVGTSLELIFRTSAHTIEAMRGRPSTSIAEAISAAGWAGTPASRLCGAD